jgi:HAD superfamily hydrolase (TIGR01509 family)
VKIGLHDVDAIIFDFDGTLADSMWVWDNVDRMFLAKRGIPFAKEYGEKIAVLGFELGAQYSIERFGLDEDPEDIIAEWKSGAEDGYATQVALKPGAREYLSYCKSQGTPLAIATSLQRHLLEPALKNNGVLGMFDAICICDELQCGGKSNPTIYREAARRLGVPAQRCAIFEDVVIPAESAKQTGAYVIGVYDEHKQQATDKLKGVVDRFIMDFSELLDEVR